MNLLFLRRYGFTIGVTTLWITAVLIEISLGVKQNRLETDLLTSALQIPSSWMAPIRSGLLRVSGVLPGFGGQLLPGLTIGDTSRVTDELNSAMKSVSMTHLVAVSGANCQIVTATVFAFLSWLGAPRWLRISGASLALVFFVALVTPQASIARAAVMSLAVLVGMASGRLVAGLPALALAVLILLIINPLWAINYGFVLSVLATAGLLTLTRPLARIFEQWMPTWLALVVAVPIAATLACQPVIILLSPNMPTYGVLANLLSVPAVTIVTIVGLLSSLASSLFMPLAVLLGWVAWLPAEWIGRVAMTLSAFPVAKIAWPPGLMGFILAALVSGLFIFGILGNRKRPQLVATGLASMVIVVALVWSLMVTVRHRIGVPSEWKIAACDVGQGDAFVFRARSHDGVWLNALVDTGRYPDRLRNCMERLGIVHLDLLVLTHYDVDHVGGVSTVSGKVSRVVAGKPDSLEDRRVAEQACVQARSCDVGHQGMSGELGSAHWRILWPNGRTSGMQVGNPGSETLLVSWEGLTALFTGDLGATAQEAMLAENPDIGVVDVLKVAHHGSSDTSENLIQAIQPRIGLISVGVENGYGHPTKKALEMLERAGTVIARTDRQGMLFVVGTANSLQLVTDE